jgi:hypothetical protein
MTTITLPELVTLKNVFGYKVILKSLRPRAVGSVIFGVIAVVMGWLSVSENPLNIVLLLIGVFLLSEGTWLIVTPKPKGMVVDGIALLLVGAWNIFVTVINLVNGGGTGGLFGVYGIFQIVWGIQSFVKYSKFQKQYNDKPSTDDMKRVNDIIESVANSNPIESEDVVQFKSGKQWMVKLLGDVAIFVTTKRNDVIVANRDEIVFANFGKKTFSKKLEFSLTVGERIIGGEISPESMKRLETWKMVKENSAR